MTEFIISSEQLERIIAAVEHNTQREINRVVIDGCRVSEIVRCRDCRYFHANTNGFDCPKLDPDGFCAWGEQREGAEP